MGVIPTHCPFKLRSFFKHVFNPTLHCSTQHIVLVEKHLTCFILFCKIFFLDFKNIVILNVHLTALNQTKQILTLLESWSQVKRILHPHFPCLLQLILRCPHEVSGGRDWWGNPRRGIKFNRKSLVGKTLMFYFDPPPSPSQLTKWMLDLGSVFCVSVFCVSVFCVFTSLK